MNKKSALVIIFLTVFIDLMGFGILIPILPTFASKELHISDFGIGVLFAVFSLMQFLFNPILGRVSDKYGRRPIILLSLLSTAVSYVIFSFSHSFLLLLISRTLGGLGGSNIGVAQAYIADITEKHERSKGMGMIGMAFGLGFMFGPMIGGFLSTFGYPVVGLVSAAFSFLAFTFTFFMLKETVHKDANKGQKINKNIIDMKYMAATLRHADIGSLVILFFIVTFSGATIYGIFAILGLKHYHFTDQQIGYLFGILGVTSAVVQGGLIRILENKISDKVMVAAGTFISIFGLALMPYGGNFLGLALIMIIQAIGTGLLQPTLLSMISKYSSAKEQGAILGLNQSLSALGRVFGPLWGGFAFSFLGYQFPFLTGGAVMFLSFIFTLYLIKTNRYNGTAEEIAYDSSYLKQGNDL